MNTGGDMEQQMAPVSACVFGTMLEGRKMTEPIMKKFLGLVAHIIEPEENSKEYRKNWARLIQKVYEIDPLTCPKCQGTMKVIGSIK
jgi:hypothetical protein